MSYDHWKTTEPDLPNENAQKQESECALVYADLARMGERLLRLRASHARLLAAANACVECYGAEPYYGVWKELQAAIASAEELKQ